MVYDVPFTRHDKRQGAFCNTTASKIAQIKQTFILPSLFSLRISLMNCSKHRSKKDRCIEKSKQNDLLSWASRCAAQ